MEDVSSKDPPVPSTTPEGTGITAPAAPDASTAAAQTTVTDAPPDPDATLEEGEECAVQTLYEGTSRCSCCIKWVKEYPPDLEVAVEQQPKVKKKALSARMRRNHDGGEGGKPLVLDSVVVRSASLKKTLAEVFAGYDGITPTLKKVVFKAPFHPFYYRWKLFRQILERQRREDPAAAAHSQLLYDVLGAELSDTMAELEDHLSHGVISAPLLWTLFEPGTRVVAKLGGGDVRRFFVVDSCKPAIDGALALMVRFVDWNGQRFGFAKAMLSIPHFGGTRAIRDLNVHPAKFLADRKKVEAEAIARGRKFEGLRGFHHMAYSGVVRLSHPQGRGMSSMFRSIGRGQVRQVADGRIVVDASNYFRETGDQSNQLDPLSEPFTPKIAVKDTVHGGRQPERSRPQMGGSDTIDQMRDEDGTTRKLIRTEAKSTDKKQNSGKLHAVRDRPFPM